MLNGIEWIEYLEAEERSVNGNGKSWTFSCFAFPVKQLRTKIQIKAEMKPIPGWLAQPPPPERRVSHVHICANAVETQQDKNEKYSQW